MQFRLTQTADVFNPVLGDLQVENGQLVLIGADTATIVEAVAQDIRSALQMFKGEWFLNPSEGVPYFENIFIKAPDLDTIKAIFRNVITSRNHVSALPKIEVSLDKRTRFATVDFVAIVSNGETLDSSKFAPFIVEF